jgi:arginine N-succinyltransferase
MFLIRNVEKRDLNAFYELASILDTYNLPKDKKLLAQIISISKASFEGKLKDPHQGRYVFVAEEMSSGRIVGTSEILAKRGTPGNPFIYCEVGTNLLKSKTLKKELPHRYIRLKHTVDGATEVGGLVVHPRYRGKKFGVGKMLSFVRFMYMKVHPGRFQKRILAELLAYLTPKGENPLWNVLGQHFTGLSYHEADRLSVSNKEFILSLFPSEKIYTCLLPARVQEILEKPGPHSIPAKILLEKIGFKYLNQVDPFDGGPLYGANQDKISIIKKTKCYHFKEVLKNIPEQMGLILKEDSGKVSVLKSFIHPTGKILSLPAETARALGVKRTGKIWVYPFLLRRAY